MPGGRFSPARLALWLLWGAALLFCLRAGRASADRLLTLYGGGYGLRSSAPMSMEQRVSARRLAADLGADIAFWGQANAAVAASGEDGSPRTAQAAVIFCEDEPALALGVRCRYGRLPSAEEADACCVSSALSLALWGARAVCGRELFWQGTARTVCGVAESETPWLLCPVPPAQAASAQVDNTEALAFTGIELHALPAGDPRGTAQQVAAAAGLPFLPVPGGTLAAAAKLLCRLPLIFAGAALALALWHALGQRLGSGARRALWFGLALALALALPALLDTLPAWLIPNRWSDFSFWRALAALPGQTLHSLLALPPSVRDDTLQMLLLQGAAADAGALALTSFAVIACSRR